MVYLSIAFFLASTFGLGFTITSFVKNSDNFLERNLMRIGFGLAMLPFLGLILNLIRIPIDWKLILALSLAYPIYYAVRYRPKPNLQFKITKTTISILVMLILFAVNFYIYTSGAFAYPYLEDDDSWSHAMGVKYVSIEKTVFAGADSPFYFDPYPPSYDLLMGLLHQTNDSIYFTLKFFNALIVSLSTIFFYFFVKEFAQNRNKALFATFALVSIPAFMSHFIWAISIAVPLYFVVFYALEKIKDDAKWWIVAALSMVTVLTATPTHSTYFGMFFVLYVITKIILEKKLLLKHIAAGALGLSLSFLFWWLPMILKHGVLGTLKGSGFDVRYLQSPEGLGQAFGGTGDRVYTFSNFFIAQKQNMINNPIGIGIFLSILTAVAVVFLFLRYKDLLKKENHWLAITLVLFIFTFYAVNAARFQIKLSPFRAWMLLAILVCILAAQGAFDILDISRKSVGRIGMCIVLLILVTGIYFTSTQQKIAVNTANWPPGAFWTSGEEIGAYVWIRDNIPRNSNMFTFVNNGPIIGMDMYTCPWCSDVRDYMKNGFNQSAQETYKWLKSKEYKYIIVDGQTVRRFGYNESNKKVQELASSGLFQPMFQNQGAIIFKI